MDAKRKADALERFESYTAVPMLVLALAIIPLLIAPLMFELSSDTETTIVSLEWIIWAAFAVEYGVRLYLAAEKWRFIKSNKIDLVVVVLPFLRPLRVVRSARLLRALRALRVVAFLGRAVAAAKDVFTRHYLHYALLVTLAVAVGGALLVEAFEQGEPDANITNVPDALWWAITTITTVGYGDLYPMTPAGRGIGAALMIVGVAMFGFLAGSLASFFVEGRKDTENEDEISERLDRIEQMLERLGETSEDDNKVQRTVP